MYKTIGAAFGLAAIVFGVAGDPFLATLAAVCGITWIAATPVFRSSHGSFNAKRTQDLGLD